MGRQGWAVASGVLGLAGLMLATFGPVLFRGGQFGLRDAAAFYYPLYLRVQQEWAAGRLPLWDPWENAGMPLLGNPTAAVLYPGKLIYAALPYPWAARSYVLAHVLLAFAAMAALLRRWAVSPVGSILGGLSFAFGAPILFQSCNVVFLVGAAWAPLGLRAADGWLRLGRRWSVAELALVLAMQVLGGDPEAAYLVAAASAGYAVVLAAGRGRPARARRWSAIALATLATAYAALLALSICEARAGRIEAGGPGSAWRPPTRAMVAAAWTAVGIALLRANRRGRDVSGLASGLTGLAAACGLAAALSGAQLLPCLEFAALTTRVSGGPNHDFYPFGLHPVRIVETVWPNLFGADAASNRSWLKALPPTYDHRIWVSSLYVGASTIVLALAAAGARGGPPWRIWLTGLTIVGLIGSFGAFGGPLFWARSIPGWSATLGATEDPALSQPRDDGLLRDGDGGAYWLLASALPGFGTFRYPGKLIVFACLGASGLAGIGWDRVARGESRRAATLALALLTASLLGSLGAAAGRRAIEAALSRRAELLISAHGRHDAHGAALDVSAAFAHGVVAMAGVLALIRIAPRRPARAGSLMIALLAVDLAVANRGVVRTVPQSVFEGVPRALAAIQEAERADPSPGPYRVHRMPPWGPVAWNLRGSATPLEEIVRWERDTLRYKHGLPFGIGYPASPGSAELLDYITLFAPSRLRLDDRAARALDVKPGREAVYYPRRAFDLWNARYFVLPARLALGSEHRGFASFLDRSERIHPEASRFEGPDGPAAEARWLREEDFQVLRNRDAYPRAWVVHRARVLEPVDDAASRRDLLGRLLFQDDAIWHDDRRPVHDLRRMAFVEVPADRRAGLSRFVRGGDPDPSESVVVERNDPQRVELSTTLRSPGLVVLADVLYPGWKLEVDGRPAPILRVNRAMRGATVEAGRHRLVYTYKPWSYRIGLLVTIAGLATLAAWAFRQISTQKP